MVNTVAVISVNWKAGQDTVGMLASLADSSVPDWFAVVCENGSPDDSFVVIQNYLRSNYSEVARSQACDESSYVFDYFDSMAEVFNIPRVTLVHSTKNLGFAGGNNLALRFMWPRCSPKFYWFLNNDTVIQSDTLEILISKMNGAPDVGICGATLVYERQRDQVQAYGGARYWPKSGRLVEVGQGNFWPAEIDEISIESSLDYISGASMFVRAEFLAKVGLMSEDYFLYFEELDWAERGRASGFRLGYASQAVVYHKEGAVLGSGKSKKRSALAEYYGLRNRLLFTRKFYPQWLFSVFAFCCLQVIRRALQGEWRRARMMAAVLVGLRSSPP